jgi:hypothetical protein
VPEARQGEQTQRIKVKDLGNTLKIWTMPKMESEK